MGWAGEKRVSRRAELAVEKEQLDQKPQARSYAPEIPLDAGAWMEQATRRDEMAAEHKRQRVPKQGQ